MILIVRGVGKSNYYVVSSRLSRLYKCILYSVLKRREFPFGAYIFYSRETEFIKA